MNSLKPVMSSPAPGSQTGPSHNTHNNVGQNLSGPAHGLSSMAPVSANMAQMAQNMSHHGNLSHNTSNSLPSSNTSVSPSKASSGTPLSLVQDKAPNSQPLALTRTPEKKEVEPNSQTNGNGTIASPKLANNAETKPQTPEISKEKSDIGKTVPTTPKIPEKASPSTPQKADVPNTSQPDGPEPPKLPVASEPPEKSPAKPVEHKALPAADVAPSQSDSKPESAKESQAKPPVKEAAKPEPPKPEVSKPDPKPEVPKPVVKPQPVAEEKKEAAAVAVDAPKKEDKAPEKIVEKVEKPEEKEKPSPPEKKPAEATKVTPKPEPKAAKSTLKLATVTTPVRKRRQVSPTKADGATPAKKVADGGDSRTKRNRTQVQPYQSPTPELAMATKLSASAGRSTPPKQTDDKLIVFYKNEYLAVRNAEGSFYVCQALQNVYRNSRKIKIRWLSQDKTADPSGETYKPDFYDVTDMETVLTTLSMSRAPSGGGSQLLKPAEEARVKSILSRALTAEKGGPTNVEVTEEHPDGLDLSLYKDESQLEKKSRKRKAEKSATRKSDADSTTAATPPKRATPKRSPRGAKPSPKATPKSAPKRKPAGSSPAPSKAAVPDKVTPKPTKATPKKSPGKPAKVTPKVDSTPKSGRRSANKAELKAIPITPIPSTSTGKATRTPRKPPANK